MLNKKQQTVEKNKNELGFTMVEMVFAILILTIALLATAAAITFALEFGAISKNVSNGKYVITSAIEEIESLRNSQRLDFKQIENVGNVDNVNSPNHFDGFSVGFKPVSLSPGPDGVNGTDDDLIHPGPDGNYGTGDDFTDSALERKGFSRQITITPLTGSNTIKKVEIKVRYVASGGKVGEITGVSYLNNEARLTR